MCDRPARSRRRSDRTNGAAGRRLDRARRARSSTPSATRAWRPTSARARRAADADAAPAPPRALARAATAATPTTTAPTSTTWPPPRAPRTASPQRRPAGRRGAVGHCQRPRQQRRATCRATATSRSPSARTSAVSTSTFSISCDDQRPPRVHARGRADRPTRSTPRRTSRAASVCTVTVSASQVSDTDTDDPPDDMLADHTFRSRRSASKACGSTTSRARGTSRRTTPSSSAACPASSTALSTNGFWVQDPAPDGDERDVRGHLRVHGAAARPPVGAAVTFSGEVHGVQGGRRRAREPHDDRDRLRDRHARRERDARSRRR